MRLVLTVLLAAVAGCSQQPPEIPSSNVITPPVATYSCDRNGKELMLYTTSRGEVIGPILTGRVCYESTGEKAGL